MSLCFTYKRLIRVVIVKIATDEIIEIIISKLGANLASAFSPTIKGNTNETILGIGSLEFNAAVIANINKLGEITVHTLLFVIIAIIKTIDIVATLYIIPITISLIKYNIVL